MTTSHIINARAALAARRNGDSRWDLLVILLTQRTGLSVNQVISNIVAMAHGETPA